MSIFHKFHKRDRNRYRKVYRYIRKKPSFEYCSAAPFEMMSGYVTFTNEDGPKTYTFPSEVSLSVVPIGIVTSVDHLGNDQADVNAYITLISTTEMRVSVSAPFSGRVHFIIVGQEPS